METETEQPALLLHNSSHKHLPMLFFLFIHHGDTDNLFIYFGTIMHTILVQNMF
jgi:hypothetical protein